MAEWSNALVLKTSVQQCTGGSNPSLSAKEKPYQIIGLFSFFINSVYNSILDEYITYSGTGTLTKNGSSCYYTITLDLNYSYNGINFNYNCIGSDDISLY